ncbi:putative protein phosphatase 2C 49 [Vitis vinifera]|uniref:protein-serine/threonine phosphatase n=1 Tax=Vitis vinifera TaxID=29760 RepID=A0A438F6N8_VITVI|nr:putative protein phosphatase 2C 49 [Vitis vinifera]
MTSAFGAEETKKGKKTSGARQLLPFRELETTVVAEAEVLCQYLGGPRAAANLQIDDMLDLPPSSPSPSSPILQAVRASQEPVAAEFAQRALNRKIPRLWLLVQSYLCACYLDWLFSISCSSFGGTLVVDCSDIIQEAVIESSTIKFVPSIRSGSYADIGLRKSMEDEHIRIDDLSAEVGPLFRCSLPSAFYAVFDGHGGPEAAAYIKRNAMRLFF